MADFTITETNYTYYNIKPFYKEIELTAGEKLSDDADLVMIASKRIPIGYKAKIVICIDAKIEKDE